MKSLVLMMRVLPAVARLCQGLALAVPEQAGLATMIHIMVKSDSSLIDKVCLFAALLDGFSQGLLTMSTEMMNKSAMSHAESISTKNRLIALGPSLVIAITAFNGFLEVALEANMERKIAKSVSGLLAFFAFCSAAPYTAERLERVEGKAWWPNSGKQRVQFLATALGGNLSYAIASFYQISRLIPNYPGALTGLSIAMLGFNRGQVHAAGNAFCEPKTTLLLPKVLPSPLQALMVYFQVTNWFSVFSMPAMLMVIIQDLFGKKLFEEKPQMVYGLLCMGLLLGINAAMLVQVYRLGIFGDKLKARFGTELKAVHLGSIQAENALPYSISYAKTEEGVKKDGVNTAGQSGHTLSTIRYY